MEQFIYDINSPYEANFNRWYTMNTKERHLHKEEIYTTKEAKSVFYTLYLEHYEVERQAL